MILLFFWTIYQIRRKQISFILWVFGKEMRWMSRRWGWIDIGDFKRRKFFYFWWRYIYFWYTLFLSFVLWGLLVFGDDCLKISVIDVMEILLYLWVCKNGLLKNFRLIFLSFKHIRAIINTLFTHWFRLSWQVLLPVSRPLSLHPTGLFALLLGSLLAWSWSLSHTRWSCPSLSVWICPNEA